MNFTAAKANQYGRIEGYTVVCSGANIPSVHKPKSKIIPKFYKPEGRRVLTHKTRIG